MSPELGEALRVIAGLFIAAFAMASNWTDI
jgi:hypothetical protein